MNIIKLSAMATLAMLAFAANSLLCRMALVETAIDPAQFYGLANSEPVRQLC